MATFLSHIFLGLTQEMDEKTKRQVALHGVVLAFVIVAVFSMAGKYILDIFGITLPAFRIAGGLLVGLVGFHLLQGDHSSVLKAKDEDTEQSVDIGVANPLEIQAFSSISNCLFRVFEILGPGRYKSGSSDLEHSNDFISKTYRNIG